MARPKCKDELLAAGQQEFDRLQQMMEAFSPAQQQADFILGDLSSKKETHWRRDKNLRDVLIHLYEWHRLLLDFVASNQGGTPKPFLPEAYNWRTYPQMNVEIWQKHQATSLAEAKRLLEESHTAVMAAAGEFSNEALFQKGVIPWSGGSVLGSYFVSCLSSHYEWAIKKLKLYKKAVR